MKAIWTLLALAGLALLGSVVVWWSVDAPGQATPAREEGVAIGGGNDGDLLLAGRNVSVRAPTEGDLAVAGLQVRITGPVDGYVMAAGADVAIHAAVGNDLWAAGREVVLNAAVGDNARLAGNSVIVQPQARIGRNALVAAYRVEVGGPVQRDLRVNAAEVSISSEIGGSVQVRSGTLRLLPGAVIHGNLITHGPNPPDIDPGARVLGSVQYQPPANDGVSGTVSWWRQWLFGFLALLMLGVATLAPAASWTARVADTIKRRVGRSLLVGISALVVIPVLAVLLAATVIGIPLAILAFALYGAALLLSGVFVSLRIGDWVMHRLGRPGSSPHRRLAAGAVLVSFVASLPWIGWLAWLLVPLIGLGALLLERNEAWRRPLAASAV